jgi:chaperone modulatory protein CbpM
MADRYTETEILAEVPSLTRARLVSYVEARVIVPVQSDAGPVYRRIDLARLHLLCDLSDQFDLEDDALGVVISLVDQLHGVRGELAAVLAALDEEPVEVRERVITCLRRTRRG